MRLRRLELKDAPLMLEWMHDSNVVEWLYADFSNKTLESCEKFIQSSWENWKSDIHMAIVDESDIYQGTVSLKNINLVHSYAEFAITIRKCAMGKGVSIMAMKEILKLGKEKLKLEKIYWCVNIDNKRAVHFYDKNKYERVERVPVEMYKRYDNVLGLIWYAF